MLQILKNLNAVLTYSKRRYENEFAWQEIMLKEDFKKGYQSYLSKKGCAITYLDNTSIITTKAGLNIFIANQWFAIGSYLVDACTELLTYKECAIAICKKMHVNEEVFLKEMKNSLDYSRSQRFLNAAKNYLQEKFPNASDIEIVAGYLLKFVTTYPWWSGNKTIDRGDFYVSPVLNSLNIVNASHGYVADIIYAYATDLRLRRLVENLESFVVSPKTKEGSLDVEETALYQMAEAIPNINEAREKQAVYQAAPKISISLASLNRFHNEG